MNKEIVHPYHFSGSKNFVQRSIDFIVPLGLFLIYFQFYNFGQISPSEMTKTSGLLAISLLGVALIIGPTARVLPNLNFLKAHRKFWGVLSFYIALTHVALVLIFYWRWEIARFVEITNPKYSGILLGIEALIILFLVTLSSNQKIIGKLNPTIWKIIQTTSYLAMFLAVFHFYIMETQQGILIIKRFLGRVTFWFSVIVILTRVLILFLPRKKG